MCWYQKTMSEWCPVQTLFKLAIISVKLKYFQTNFFVKDVFVTKDSHRFKTIFEILPYFG